MHIVIGYFGKTT